MSGNEDIVQRLQKCLKEYEKKGQPAVDNLCVCLKELANYTFSNQQEQKEVLAILERITALASERNNAKIKNDLYSCANSLQIEKQKLIKLQGECLAYLNACYSYVNMCSANGQYQDMVTYIFNYIKNSHSFKNAIKIVKFIKKSQMDKDRKKDALIALINNIKTIQVEKKHPNHFVCEEFGKDFNQNEYLKFCRLIKERKGATTGEKHFIKITSIAVVLLSIFGVLLWHHTARDKIFPIQMPVEFVHGDLTIVIDEDIHLDDYKNAFKGYNCLGFEDEHGNKITTVKAERHKSIKIYPILEPITYNITYTHVGVDEQFKANIQGDKIENFTVLDKVTLPTLTCDGYEFVGCFVNGKPKSEFEEKTYGDKQVEVRWQPINYSISYTHQGVSEEFEANIQGTPLTSFNINTNQTLPVLTNNGYEFLGYTLNGNPITKIEKGTIQNQHLVANWKTVKYTISYAQSGIQTEFLNLKGDKILTYTIEDEVILPTFSNLGYSFDGLYINDQKKTKINKGTTGNIQVVAKFQPIVYAINYSQSGILKEFENIIGIKPATYTIENELILPTLTNVGYAFDGYFVDNQKITKIAKGSVDNLNLETRWTAEQYNIIYSHQNMDTAFIPNIQGEKPQTFTIEKAVSLPMLSNDGYEFLGCFVKDEETTQIPKGTVGDVQVVNKWKATEYAIAYQSRYAEKTNTNVKTYTIEDEISISSLSLENYKFVNWQNEQKEVVTTIPKGSMGDIVLSATWSMVGEGTAQSPYLIYNEDQLKTLFTEMNAYYELQNDIVISYSWSPIGKQNNKFNGKFDGKNHTLTINEIESGITEFAMFGYVGALGEVKNLNVASTAGEWAENFVCSRFAGVVLYNEGKILNCENQISIIVKENTSTLTEDYMSYALGGICYKNYAIIDHCNNTGSLSIFGSKACVLAGIAVINTGENARITDCFTNQKLLANAENLVYVGKFVVLMENGAEFGVTLPESLTPEFVSKLTDLVQIQASVNTQQVGKSPVIIKEVALNNNYLSKYGDMQNDGYCYWRYLIYTSENKHWLETWVCKKEEYNILNKSAQWEAISKENDLGFDYTKDKGGYAYAYNANHEEI